MNLMRTRFDVPCTIAVEHTDMHLHAHVEFDDDIMINPGDRVRVHGAAVRVPFGGTLTERRTATIVRATLFERIWERLKGDLDVTEMYEITFTSGSR